MKRVFVGLCCALALVEFLVLGSTMGFEECRSRGGIIIRDAGSPMVACDPRVRREPVPANEFDHPGWLLAAAGPRGSC